MPKETKAEKPVKRPGGFPPQHCSSPDPEIDKDNSIFKSGPKLVSEEPAESPKSTRAGDE